MLSLPTFRYIKDSIKAPFVGGKSKKFPEGLQIGMFSNACGDAEWQNAESYHKEKVIMRVTNRSNLGSVCPMKYGFKRNLKRVSREC